MLTDIHEEAGFSGLSARRSYHRVSYPSQGILACFAACFAAQQSAEKAVKALHLFSGQEAGHVVATLLPELPSTVSATPDLIEKGRVLDNFYIPTRYANGHPAGSPYEHYGPLQSGDAIAYASEILEFVRTKMA